LRVARMLADYLGATLHGDRSRGAALTFTFAGRKEGERIADYGRRKRRKPAIAAASSPRAAP